MARAAIRACQRGLPKKQYVDTGNGRSLAALLLQILPDVAHGHTSFMARIDLIEVLGDIAKPLSLSLRLGDRGAIAKGRIGPQPRFEPLLSFLLQGRAGRRCDGGSTVLREERTVDTSRPGWRRRRRHRLRR